MAATTTASRLAAEPASKRTLLIARLACTAAALVALTWAAVAALPLLQAAQLQAVARQIITQQSLRYANLETLEASVGTPSSSLGCNAQYLRGVMLIRSVLAEDALNRGDLAQIDTRLPALGASARALLACSPYEGIGWFVLYWASLNQIGPTPQTLELLTMSYTVSPREAWIALMRNASALRVGDLLPESTQQLIAAEWRDLVQAGLHGIAAASIGRAGPNQRARLIATSASIPPVALRVFARQAFRAGYDIDFPTLPRLDGFRN